MNPHVLYDLLVLQAVVRIVVDVTNFFRRRYP